MDGRLKVIDVFYDEAWHRHTVDSNASFPNINWSEQEWEEWKASVNIPRRVKLFFVDP